MTLWRRGCCEEPITSFGSPSKHLMFHSLGFFTNGIGGNSMLTLHRQQCHHLPLIIRRPARMHSDLRSPEHLFLRTQRHMPTLLIGTQRLSLEKPSGTKFIPSRNPSGHTSVQTAQPDKNARPVPLFANRPNEKCPALLTTRNSWFENYAPPESRRLAKCKHTDTLIQDEHPTWTTQNVVPARR